MSTWACHMTYQAQANQTKPAAIHKLIAFLKVSQHKKASSS